MYLETDGEVVHVYPLFGPPHTLSKDCWCHPEPDEVEGVLVHNSQQ